MSFLPLYAADAHQDFYMRMDPHMRIIRMNRMANPSPYAPKILALPKLG